MKVIFPASKVLDPTCRLSHGKKIHRVFIEYSKVLYCLLSFSGGKGGANHRKEYMYPFTVLTYSVSRASVQQAIIKI